MIKCVKDISPELKYPGPWPERRRYRFLKLGLETQSNSPALAGLIETIYGSFRSSKPAPASAVTYLLEDGKDRETPYRTIDPGYDSFLCSDPGRAVSFFGAQLMCNHLYRLPFLFIHGAALEKAGRVFIFAGESGGGKTTFILSLGREGFSFYSDEFAPLSLGGGGVYPFPRALLLGPEHLDRFAADGELPFFLDYQEKSKNLEPPRRHILAPGKVFTAIGQTPAPPAAYCFLDGFSERATTARPLAAGEALERLLKLAVNTRYLAPSAAGPAIETLVAALSRVPAYRLRPGPPDEEPGKRARIIEGLAAGAPVGAGDLEKIGRRCLAILEQEKISPRITRMSTKWNERESERTAG